MPFEQYINGRKEEVEPKWIKATVEVMNAQPQVEESGLRLYSVGLEEGSA